MDNPITSDQLQGVKIIRDVCYRRGRAHERHYLDLYIPDQSGQFPLMLWIHGGAWLMGDKSWVPIMRAAEQGWVVASVNYRLSQHAVYPAQLQDVNMALRYLWEQADLYQIDRHRIIASGHSAGAHLAALLTVREKLFSSASDIFPSAEFTEPIQGAVLFSSPTDLGNLDIHTTLENGVAHDKPDSAVTKLLGGLSIHKPTLAKRASPINYVSDSMPPIHIQHGLMDDHIPVMQSIALYQLLKECGATSSIELLPDVAHDFEFSDAVIAFLNNYSSVPIESLS